MNLILEYISYCQRPCLSPCLTQRSLRHTATKPGHCSQEASLTPVIGVQVPLGNRDSIVFWTFVIWTIVIVLFLIVANHTRIFNFSHAMPACLQCLQFCMPAILHACMYTPAYTPGIIYLLFFFSTNLGEQSDWLQNSRHS